GARIGIFTTSSVNLNGVPLTVEYDDGNKQVILAAPTNHAPTMDLLGEPKLTTLPLNPTSNPGTLLKSILARSFVMWTDPSLPGSRELIFDQDAGDGRGIAVTGVDSTHGNWEYSLD